MIGVWVHGDMANYTVARREAFTLKLSNGYTINSMPLPGGGPIVGMIHNIISGKYGQCAPIFNFFLSDDSDLWSNKLVA